MSDCSVVYVGNGGFDTPPARVRVSGAQRFPVVCFHSLWFIFESVCVSECVVYQANLCVVGLKRSIVAAVSRRRHLAT